MTGILNRIRGQRLSAIALLCCVAWNSIGTGERLDQWIMHIAACFIGSQGPSSFEGSFKSFQTMITFDPAKPETGKITADHRHDQRYSREQRAR